MRNQFGQVQERAAIRAGANGTLPSAVAPTVKEIPYDYVARFKLEGRRANRVQDVINISVEGAFVAVAVGYSFIPPKLPKLPLPLGAIPQASTGGITIATSAPLTFPATLVDLVAEAIAARLSGATGADQGETRKQLLALETVVTQRLMGLMGLVDCLLVRLCGIDFKYSIIDSGSGRELQNLPIHNIAGLGESSGDRPFRPLAKPMLFMPRSTIRIEVEEISEGPIYSGAELFIVLHGYKMLGYQP